MDLADHADEGDQKRSVGKAPGGCAERDRQQQAMPLTTRPSLAIRDRIGSAARGAVSNLGSDIAEDGAAALPRQATARIV